MKKRVADQQYIVFLDGEAYGGGDLDYMKKLIADYLTLFQAHDMSDVDFKIVKNTGQFLGEGESE